MYKEAEFPESLKGVIIQDQPDRVKFPQLLNGEIHLWTASLVPSMDKIERLRSFLSPAEKRRRPTINLSASSIVISLPRLSYGF